MSRTRQATGTEIVRIWGPWVECFGVPRLKLNWSIQTKKSGVLVTPTRLISKEGTGRQETVDKKGYWGSHTRSVHLLVSLQAVV